jgi:hypothetical protein
VCFLSEELVEDVLAIGNQLLSDVAIFDGLHSSFLMAYKGELKFDKALAEVAKKDEVRRLS